VVLACESELWEAPDSQTWYNLLHVTSPYGDIASRILGCALKDVLSLVQTGTKLPYQGQFPPCLALILAQTYIVSGICETNFGEVSAEALDQAEDTLNRWFTVYVQATTHHSPPGFSHDGLPTFLVGKAVLHCARLGHSVDNKKFDRQMRVSLITAWFVHFRAFLDTHSEITPEIWDTLPIPQDGSVLPELSEKETAPTPPDPLADEDDTELDSLIPALMSFKFGSDN
jgi:hypothetical protein